MGKRITLNIPHSGLGGLWTADWNSQVELAKAVRDMTDWFTDVMFVPTRGLFGEGLVTPFVFAKSRFVVDVERLVDDDMESIGQGIVYTRFGDSLARNVTPEEREALCREREGHLLAIEGNILGNDGRGHGNILIDCHSFHSRMGDMDICLGFNEDTSKPSGRTLATIMETFRSHGLTVAVNTPFANSLQPVRDPGALAHGYCSFMLELNKRIYFDESRCALTEGSAGVKEILMELYRRLLEE